MRFAEVLSRRIGFLAIAEVKRRSPSGGDLRPDADPGELARAFERAGAAAVSILVDERFGGTIDDLRAARRKATLPLLAKGFFSTPEQLRELREAGADAVLLILRDLDNQTTLELMQTARALKLDALVEVHDEEELQRAVAVDAPVIGINARDLSTFAIDRTMQLALVAKVPPGRAVVAESGVSSRAQGAAAELAGAKAILVGSTLMRARDPASKLAELMSRPLVKVCGLTREEDVAVASEAGADMAGFILAAESPRRTDDLLPVPETMLSVAVHVGEYEERGADLVQLYRRENGHRSRDGELLSHGREVALVADLPWEGRDPNHFQFARSRSIELGRRLMLAGRLGPDNVREAIEIVNPWAVDAASRLEVAPGIKDHAKVRAFVEAAR